MNIIHTLLGPSSFWIWRNALEICIFSMLFYALALYLRRDRTKNLLPYFYAYCALSVAAYFLQLSTLNYALVLFAPACICLFILFHQETLQRNFIALKQRKPHHETFEGSIEILMRCMLIALNKKQEVSVLIEYQDKLDDFLDCTYMINSPLNHDLLTLLLESPSLDHQKMIWITHNGIIRGINASWHDSFTQNANLETSQLISPRDLHEWYTTKTDCLTIALDPVARTFALTAHGSTNPQATSHHALQIIKKHSLNLAHHHKSFSTTQMAEDKKERGIHVKTKTTHHQQRTP